jgi:ABC-type Zn uptake system ZnuABC Zn-binding protein ZnuA
MRTILRTLSAAVVVFAAAFHTQPAAAKIRVAASLTDLASIASSVGGDQVEAFSIARPNADPHHVEVLPSYMVKVSRADLYLKVGLGLDQWADGIVDGSRNAKLKVVDCSENVPVLEKPTETANLAKLGDVHPFGNPHYWLDPRNGAIVAKHLADAFADFDPAHADDYHARADAFAKDVDAAYAREKQVADALPVKSIFTYHASWVYFAHAFGLETVGTAEPVPGLPPTAKHLDELVRIAKERKVPVLIQEPYFSDDAGSFLARETGLRPVKVAPSCDGPEAGSYLAHFDDVLKQVAGSAPAASGH